VPQTKAKLYHNGITLILMLSMIVTINDKKIHLTDKYISFFVMIFSILKSSNIDVNINGNMFENRQSI